MYKNEVREISRESRAQVSGRRSNLELLRSRLLEPLYIPAINRFSDWLTEAVRKYTRRRKPKAKR